MSTECLTQYCYVLLNQLFFELVTIAAQKKNLKESSTKAYCHALSPFLNATGKPSQELTVADVDDYLTTKRLMGILPETYR